MPEINFREPAHCDYLYIDDANRVHLLLPIIGGEEIGLDNTCQTTLELAAFFYGKDVRLSAEQILNAYIKNIQTDIATINALKNATPTIAYQSVLNQKTQRLQQIRYYLDLMALLKINFDRDGEIANLGLQQFPVLPRGILQVLKFAENGFAIQLSPHRPDSYMRFTDPVFKLARNISGGLIQPLNAGLGYRLRTTFSPIGRTIMRLNRKSAREQLIDTVVARVNQTSPHLQIINDENFDALKDIIRRELTRINPDVSLERDNYGNLLDFAGVTASLQYDENDTVREWANGFVRLAVPDETFWQQQAGSVFYDDLLAVTTVEEAERLSIKVQFFLGEVNGYCRTHQLTDKDFGAVFDDEWHGYLIAISVKTGLENGDAIEPLIFAYINTIWSALGLTAPLSLPQQEDITKKFNQHYTIIKDSPHFDEFFVVNPDLPGKICVHKNRISCHFLDFFHRHVPHYVLEPGFRHHADGIAQRRSSRLNHKNNIVMKEPEQIIFRTKVLEKLASTPDTLLAYLVANTSAGSPNYFELTDEMHYFISYHRAWPALERQLFASPSIPLPQKQDLLNLLGRDIADKRIRSINIWRRHSPKPLVEIELSAIAKGLQKTADNYRNKRSFLWWKGSQNAARAAQCAALTAAAHDITELLASRYVSKDKIFENILRSIGVLVRIDKEIAAEFNLFQSHLQLEIQDFQRQLQGLCQIEHFNFQSFDIHEAFKLDMASQLARIPNESIRELVRSLPAHYQTNEAISFFNRLSLAEARVITRYLKLDYRKLDDTVNKDTLLLRDIPAFYEEINAAFLTELKDRGSISPKSYQRLMKLAPQIPPELLTEKTASWWLCYTGSKIESGIITLCATINPNEFSLAHIEGLNLVNELGLTQAEFAANPIDILTLGRGRLDDKARHIAELLQAIQPSELALKKQHALTLAATLAPDGAPYIRLALEALPGAPSPFIVTLPLSAALLQIGLLQQRTTPVDITLDTVDLDYLNQLLTIREGFLLLPANPWFAEAEPRKMLVMIGHLLMQSPELARGMTERVESLLALALQQILPSYDAGYELLQTLNENWWQPDNLKKLANLDARMFTQDVMRFLNRNEVGNISESTIQGLNFYALSGQVPRIRWDIANLDAQSANFLVLKARLDQLGKCTLANLPLVAHSLSPAFFTEENVAFTQQLNMKLCAIGQVPSLNKFIENTPVLDQRLVAHLQQFVVKFPHTAVPETSSLVFLSTAVSNQHAAKPDDAERACQLDTLDIARLADDVLEELGRELDKLSKPFSTSGKSILGGLQYYATPHWTMFKSSRDEKMAEYMEKYSRIFDSAQTLLTALQVSFSDKNNPFTVQQQQRLQGALHALKRRIDEDVEVPLKNSQAIPKGSALFNTLNIALQAFMGQLSQGLIMASSDEQKGMTP